MGKGRPPRVINDNEVSKFTKKHVKDLENCTPIYESQEFIPPPNLNKRQLKIWDHLVNIFRQTVNCKVSDADTHLMELYCIAKSTADEADEQIRKDPRPLIPVTCGTDAKGNPKSVLKPNPYYKLRLEYSELCIKFYDQLGLSPLARARAGVKGANAKKEIDIFNLLNNRSDD